MLAKHFSVLLALLISVDCSKQPEEATVRQRFDSYMTAWRDRDGRKVWNMMSPRLRKGNDAEASDVIQLFKNRGIYPVKYVIRRVDIEHEVSNVFANIEYSDLAGNKAAQYERCRFVLVQGTWYFEECLLAS